MSKYDYLKHSVALGKDVYRAGGSWTAANTDPVVDHLHETPRIPWSSTYASTAATAC